MKHNILSLAFLLVAPVVQAQTSADADSLIKETLATSADSVRLDTVDFPESMIISEDTIIKDKHNSGLVAGEGVVRDLTFTDQELAERLAYIPTTIDLPLNSVTRQYIDAYIKRKSSIAVMLGSSNYYMPIFEEALEKYDLPLELRYLPVIESAMRPTATSRAGAAGLWQLMLTTARQYGLEVNTLVDERRDPIKSTEAAAHLLSDLYNMFGDWSLAIAAYNCGPGNVTKAIARAGNPEVKDFWTIYNYLPRETRGYLPAFIAATYIMYYYCDHGIVPMQAALPEDADTVHVKQQVTFSQVAALCNNLTVDSLRILNPQYRRDIIPANHSLCLPSENIEDFIYMEDSIYASTVKPKPVEPEALKKSAATSKKSSRAKYVTVRSGQSLSVIASRNGTTVAKLRRLNGIKGNMIRPGQRLRVR